MVIDHKLRAELSAQLLSAAGHMGLALDAAQVEQLITYLELLVKWNKAYNLTSVREPQQMLTRHLIDSLSIAPYIKGPRIIDVGTGPGLPGIPLAIVFPQIDFLLLDSNGKKTRFLTQCKIELGLSNIEVVKGRVEASHFAQPFNQVLSRAFSSLGQMLSLCAHLLADQGQFLAMKGVEPEAEKGDIAAAFSVEQSIQLHVPGCDGARHLIIIGRSNS